MFSWAKNILYMVASALKSCLNKVISKSQNRLTPIELSVLV